MNIFEYNLLRFLCVPCGAGGCMYCRRERYCLFTGFSDGRLFYSLSTPVKVKVRRLVMIVFLTLSVHAPWHAAFELTKLDAKFD
jgi:hypothetical protein